VSASGDRIFVGTRGGAVLRVRAATGEVEGERRGHRADIVALALDESVGLLASADGRVVRVGKPDDAEGEVILPRREHRSCPVRTLQLGPDGKALFIERGAASCKLDLWSAATRTLQSMDLPELPNLSTGEAHMVPAGDRVFVVASARQVWFSQSGLAEYA